MADRVSIYRKRLNRWKNIGVFLVFFSVGAAIFAVGMIKYFIVIEDLDKHEIMVSVPKDTTRAERGSGPNVAPALWAGMNSAGGPPSPCAAASPTAPSRTLRHS